MQRRVRASLAIWRIGQTMGATRVEAARAALRHLILGNAGSFPVRL